MRFHLILAVTLACCALFPAPLFADDQLDAAIRQLETAKELGTADIRSGTVDILEVKVKEVCSDYKKPFIRVWDYEVDEEVLVFYSGDDPDGFLEYSKTAYLINAQTGEDWAMVSLYSCTWAGDSYVTCKYISLD